MKPRNARAAAATEVATAAVGSPPLGYDLRITRAVDWDRNEGCEITIREWQSIVDSDPELLVDQANGPCAVRFGETGWFDWFEGNVFTTDPEPTVVTKMLAIAEKLSATVQGDDGEFYDSAHDWRQSRKRR